VIFIERISHSVDETIARVRALLATKRIREFGFIDRSVEAEKARLSMPKTQVLVFGNPKRSAPLMLAAPRTLDLPPKLLVREDVRRRMGELLVRSDAPRTQWVGGELRAEHCGDRK
jgi:uncharacterized protein (DUF302 family)